MLSMFADKQSQEEGGTPGWPSEVQLALLDSPSLLEGAFCLTAARTLLLSDTMVMVSCWWSGSSFSFVCDTST